ncbi:MAG: aminopeptidase P family N-terminal domain-containing protein, partial [Alphaproteobacteria bacterium]
MDQPTLTKLLKAEGIAMSATELHTLAQGAAAAPPGLNPDRWMNLVTPAPTLRLKTVLRDLMQGITSASTSSESAVSRLIALRKALVDANIDGFIVPRADEHQGEYVPSCAQRLSWLTGFTGSAGTVAVLDDRAALFVDGRYTLQAEMEVDQELYQVVSIADTSMDDWLADELPDGSRLGYDPRLHSRNQAQRLRKTCESAGSRLIAVDQNPLDSVWTTQPPPPISPVVAHDERFAGQSLKEKCIQIASRISESGSEATVLTMTDSIAWLLNLRGGDVEFTPLAMA